MDRELNQKVRNLILVELAKAGVQYVPVAISNRHVHLCRADIDKLFGLGYQLKLQKSLSQPNQVACEEKITLVGPKGKIEDVRILGPQRKQTQVEVSFTDSFKLGTMPIVRMSGNLSGSPGIRLVGPQGGVELSSGLIISERHLHMSREEADAYGLKDGDAISIRKAGARPTVFEGVIVRSGEGHSLEVHLDTDEGNTAAINCGDLLEIVGRGQEQLLTTIDAPQKQTAMIPLQEQTKEPVKQTVKGGDAVVLITEEMVIAEYKNGVRHMQRGKRTLVTPLAKDKAYELGMTIEQLSE